MSAERLESSRRVREAAAATVAACRGCCTGSALRAAYDKIDRLGGDAR
jgi:hypothetical protein